MTVGRIEEIKVLHRVFFLCDLRHMLLIRLSARWFGSRLGPDGRAAFCGGGKGEAS